MPRGKNTIFAIFSKETGARLGQTRVNTKKTSKEVLKKKIARKYDPKLRKHVEVVFKEEKK